MAVPAMAKDGYVNHDKTLDVMMANSLAYTIQHHVNCADDLRQD